MRMTRTLVALALLIAATAGLATAQDKYTDPGLVPTTQTAPIVGDYKPIGTLTFYADRGSFQAANPGLPLEDFTGTIVPPNNVCSDVPPLNSATNDACFPAGGVIPGFDLDVTIDTGGGAYVVLTVGFLGVSCISVGPNSFSDELDLDFSPAVMAAAFDLYTPLGGGEPYVIEVFGPGGSLGSTPATGGGLGGSFFGVDTVDPGGISRIEVREGIDGTGELICDFEFGGVPVPVSLQSIDVE